jgi:Domain of unknown function (DUF5916)/Carbohydrate family 9 binding domain-like
LHAAEAGRAKMPIRMPSVFSRLACASAIVLICSAPASAQATFDIKTVNPETFRAIALKITEAQRPDIDGKLTDGAWKLAPVQGNFIQREPAYGAASTEKTEFRILYDDRALYIGVWVFESDPSAIMGSEMKRDAGLNKGDQLKITIDTFHDHRNAFYFSTNPLGAYKDANTIENGRTINYDWNAVWNNKTSIDDKGWYIEIEIPLSQLRFKTTIGESTWGLNLCRILFRKNEEAYWVPFPREWGANGFARVSNAGVLEGLNDLKARRRIEFVPFLSPTLSKDFGSVPAAAQGSKADAKYGGDFKIGVTDDLIADFTYHTDFAQVEADQEVVNLTRFSLFFPEKRQFFTETAGIFDFGKSVAAGLGGEAAANDPGLLNLFYSRRIGLVDGQQVPIIGGGRLTGRIGDYAVGVMNISTQEETLATRELDNANFTVVRLKRNVLRNSNIGALLVNSANGISDYNRAIGIDGGFVLGPRVSLTTVLAKTFSPDSTGEDIAGVVDLGWKTDRFVAGGQYLDVGQKFNAEMGYIPRTDIRSGHVRAGWTPRPKFGGIRQLFFAGSANYYENHAGVVDSRTQQVSAQMQRQDTSGAFVSFTNEHDNLAAPFATAGTLLAPGPYSWRYATMSYSSDRTRRVYGTLGTDFGGYYNGERQSVRANLTLQAGKTLLFEPQFVHNRVTLAGRPLYTSNVLNFRVSHSFSPDFYLKGFVQYNDDRKTASFNFLWWYHYRPGSDVYVVYNQGWDTDLPLTSRDAIERSYRVRSRSLAVKMTYWLAR